jgi:hypothetical protein
MRRWYPIGAVVVALALLVGAQSAHGAVTHRAKVWYYQQPHSYDEASKTLTLNYRLYSNNKRCIDKYSISDVDLVLYFQPAEGYATGDGPFTNLVGSQDTFTLKRVGLGHYSISLPGAQSVATVNPDGSNGGTYSLESWWRAWIGPNHAQWHAYVGSRISVVTGRPSNDNKNLGSGPVRQIIYYRRKHGKRITHKVLCGRPFQKDVDQEDADIASI